MSKNISISTLMKSSKQNISSNNLTISTMIKNIKESKKEKQYNIKEIIEERRKQEEDKEDAYKQIYSIIMNKIFEYIKENKQYLIYSIPITNSNKYYNYNECLAYILRRLRDNKLTVALLANYNNNYGLHGYNYNQILISWRFLIYNK